MTMKPLPISRGYYFILSRYLSEQGVFASWSGAHTLHTLPQPAAFPLHLLGLHANMPFRHCQLNLTRSRNQAYFTNRSLKVLVQLSYAMPSSVLQLCACLRLLSSLASIADGAMAPHQWKYLSMWCMQLTLQKLQKSDCTTKLRHALAFVSLHALYVTCVRRSLLFIACPSHSLWIHTSLIVGRRMYSLIAHHVLSAYSCIKIEVST